jgi:F0F1-type ATP synthase membrane subunit b/b'
MAAANEAQGFKIAVAVLIALVVMLIVTSYFLYSNYSSAEARLAQKEEEVATKSKTANLALTQYEELKRKLGTRAEEADAQKDEIVAHTKKVDERLNNIVNSVNAAVTRAQEAKAASNELQQYKDNIQQLAASFRNEPNKTYIALVDRALELMENLALLTTELSTSYQGLRQSLESETSVSKAQVDAQTKAAATSQSDLLAEQKKHVDERQRLVDKTTELQTDNDKKATDIANNLTKIKQMEGDFAQQRDTLRSILTELRDRLERKETVLDRPDGYVTYVDYERHEVLVNITRRMGARPQMKMTIFDAASPGIPTERPKGTIELTQVGDQFSAARITKQMRSTEPIRIGDIVYSPAWSPNMPMRFALVGKMDVNQDDTDDRQELKRMIEEAGGVVDFDLPPPDVGRESGTLSPRIDWYVIDERPPLRERFRARSEVSLSSEAALEKRKGEVIKEARASGIRPLPIEKLLAFLGYDMNTPIVGRAEAVDRKALGRLTGPRRAPEKAAQPAAEASKAEPASKAEEPEMKNEPAPENVKPAPEKAKTKTAIKKKVARKRGRLAQEAAEAEAEPNN